MLHGKQGFFGWTAWPINSFDKIIIPFGEYDFISVIGDGLIWAKKGNDSQIIEIR